MKKSNKLYLFVGPQRSSTTSLYTSLLKHNSINLMAEKENNYWQKSVTNFDEYLQEFPKGKYLFRVDICPQYFSDKVALKKISKVQDKFHKIIFLYRNPFERAESFLKLQYAYGRDVLKLINNESFKHNFLCYLNLCFCLELFRSDKFYIVPVTNLESFVAEEFKIPQFKLQHIHSSFGNARFKKFNRILLPIILKILRRVLRLNRLVDNIKENKLIKLLIFKNYKYDDYDNIQKIIQKYSNEIEKETNMIEKEINCDQIYKPNSL